MARRWVVAELQRRCCHGQQRPQMLLPFADRHLADSLTIEVQEVEQEKDKRLATPVVRGVRIRLKEVEPSGRMPHSSPSS